ncbi:uncharacterized protein Dwil_GK13884 [Drosophila willistoni]|uniref:Matrin-type domain-containing protein n=1 Tax=Drosophila willistoni TaxID=7260 RepID=B4NJW2_DROWI|nr:uncharacterized protein Dwil_GK13884 [Drosophila willistoni]
MANKNINNNSKSTPASIIDGRKFLDMLSTISLEEVLNLEFRCMQHEKWQKMITLGDDKNKKLYHCNVCNVVQYGDKNLFSHLSGKRHNANMESKISDKHNNNSSSNQKNTQSNEIVANPLNSKTQTTTNKQSGDNSAIKSQRPGNSEDKTRDSKANRGEKIPEIVKNPLAGADASKTGITCVPLAKLLSINSDKTETSTDQIEVISLDDTDPEAPSDTRILAEESPSTSQGRSEKTTKSRSDRNERNRVLIPAITSVSGGDSRKNQSKSTGERQVAVFESKPNPNEIVGVLGVEYVIKIVKTLNERNPRYQCSLCDVTTDQAAMQCHLVGYNHMLKYCEKHFPTAMAQYRQYMVNVPEHKVCKVLVPILKKLAIAIEKHHGRGSAFLCYDYTYQKNKANIVAKALNRKHSSEMMGPSFIHVVDAQEVDALIENANKRVVQEPPPANYVINTDPHFMHTHYQGLPYYDPNSSIPNNNYNNFPEQNSMEMMVDDETHKRMVENFLRHNEHGQSQDQRSQNRGSKRHRSRSTSMERKRRRSLSSQWNVERRSLSPLREGDIWQAYRHMVDQKVRELNVFFELYKGDPEEHPQYQEEWQKFWKRRKDELISAGINHRTYNYQNEWVLFFNARIEELYNQDVENIKIKCRERLCLPMTNDNLPNPKYHVHTTQSVPDRVSPMEDKPDEEEDEPPRVNVIHVLRLLTAMEDNLGSLGPHITEMLAKALQTQKVHPDKLNSLILTHENCALLETAKEKFTGLVISKILDANKERAIKRAINDTNLLLKTVPRMIRKSPNNDMNLHRPSGDPHINLRKQLPIQIESSMDKTELAAKLASTITSQGKTSINREQLQQIIQVYSMIEKKKRLEGNATNDLETFNNSVNNQRSDVTEKPNNNNPTPVVNYQEHISYDNTRNIQNTAPMPYQGLLLAPNYYGNSNNSNVDGSGGSFYGGGSNVMSNFPASGNYLSANVARMNNTNYNNSNLMGNYGNNNNNQQDVGSNMYNPYQKTDGGGQFSMNTPNSMRSNADMLPYYNSSNSYNRKDYMEVYLENSYYYTPYDVDLQGMKF